MVTFRSALTAVCSAVLVSVLPKVPVCASDPLTSYSSSSTGLAEHLIVESNKNFYDNNDRSNESEPENEISASSLDNERTESRFFEKLGNSEVNHSEINHSEANGSLADTSETSTTTHSNPSGQNQPEPNTSNVSEQDRLSELSSRALFLDASSVRISSDNNTFDLSDRHITSTVDTLVHDSVDIDRYESFDQRVTVRILTDVDVQEDTSEQENDQARTTQHHPTTNHPTTETTARMALPTPVADHLDDKPERRMLVPGLERPSGYEQLTDGIYVPREYLIHPPSSSEITAHATGGAGNPIPAIASIPSSRPTTDHIGSRLPSAIAPTTHSNSALHYPLPQLVTLSSPYGMRRGRMHRGVDLATPVGTPVLAALPGVVVFVGWQRGYGKTVIIQHQDGSLQTLYAHLSNFYVQQGQQVAQGQAIALSGNTGHTTGPHLHFELREQNLDGQWEAVNTNALIAQAEQWLIAGQSLPPHQWDWSISTAIASTVSNRPLQTELRVALAVDADTLQVGSSTDALIIGMDGQHVLGTSAGGTVITYANQGIEGGFFIQPTQGGMVYVNGAWYRGKVLVAQRPGGLIAVNWVGMEDYLASVVGSEMYPTWDLDALKAQAIAARSYALTYRYRPASPDWYDLTNTPRYQRYAGVSREFTSSVQAVAETWGMVLTADPSQVPAGIPEAAVNSVGLVEAMYASTQSLVDQVHRGFGLSQHGAAYLASTEGYDYLSILGHYYPGTQLSQLPESM